MSSGPASSVVGSKGLVSIRNGELLALDNAVKFPFPLPPARLLAADAKV